MTTSPPGIVCSTQKAEVTQRFAFFNVMGVTLVTLALLFLVDPGDRPGDLGRFLGRFHPAIVHLPIGLVALAIGLDLATRLGRCTMEWARWVYVAGSWVGVAAIAAGLLQAQAGGYEADVLRLHRLSGIAVAIGSAALPWLHSVIWSRGGPDGLAIGASLTVGVALLVAGHQGGTLTHGSGYLTAHAPSLLRSVLGAEDPRSRLALGDPDTTRVFGGIVAPILNDRCVSCHGQGRTRGGLDLRSASAIGEGGDDGPVVRGGRAQDSPLVTRLLLPENHEDKMPPVGATALSPSDARLLAWWVESGADFDQTISSSSIPPDVRAILDAHGLGDIKTGVWALEIGPAPASALEALESSGATVRVVAQEEDLLFVRCDSRAECFGDGGAALLGLAEHITWLDLARTDVTDQDLELLASLVNLEKVWLQKTGISNPAPLANAPYLLYLNVSETRVTPEALEAVSEVERVYSWGSPADAN